MPQHLAQLLPMVMENIEKVSKGRVDLVKVPSRQNVENASCLLLAACHKIQEDQGPKKATVQVLSRMKRKYTRGRTCSFQTFKTMT